MIARRYALGAICGTLLLETGCIPPDPFVGTGGSSSTASTTGAGAPALAASRDTTCAVFDDGRTYCWGNNDTGQLGIYAGDLDPHPLPVLVPALTKVKVTGLAAGDDFFCALIDGGGVKCWGGDDQGQAGHPSLMPLGAPTDVANVTAATQIAAGGKHACALFGSGDIGCWGSNGAAQLGIPADAAPHPELVLGMKGASSVSAGRLHSCAIIAGTAQCWGSNSQGQLALPADLVQYAMPQDSGVTATIVAAGGAATCAGSPLLCWGANGDGQLGNGSTAASATPGAVKGLTNVDALVMSTGPDAPHTCALVVDKVQCWGANTEGETGTGDPSTSVLTPKVVLLPGPATPLLAAGHKHTCAHLANGTFACWGQGGKGQLGNGGVTDSPTPVLLKGCDHEGSCTNCEGCARGNTCLAYARACQANPDCLTLLDCSEKCVSDDIACKKKCATDTPNGLANMKALLECETCSACPNDCATLGMHDAEAFGTSCSEL